jgi:L-arabinose isomerase
MGAGDFVNGWNDFGPAHHCAVGAGRIAGKIKKSAALPGIEWAQIC